MRRAHVPLASLVVALTAGMSSARAADPDAACKPVIDADKARAAAPAWHAKKTMDGMNMEIIRVGTEVYANMAGTGWKKMPAPMAKTIVDAGNQADQYVVTDCRELGNETVDGVPTTVWSFRTKVEDSPPVESKVWIGTRDGLPYREEGEKHAGTTVYDGITAPSP